LESQVAPEAMILSGCFGWAKKEIVELAMGRKKALSVSRGFEALHDPLASSGRLVRILRPIVEAFVLAMFDTGHDLALCGAIRAEFVGDHERAAKTLGFYAALSKGGVG